MICVIADSTVETMVSDALCTGTITSTSITRRDSCVRSTSRESSSFETSFDGVNGLEAFLSMRCSGVDVVGNMIVRRSRSVGFTVPIVARVERQRREWWCFEIMCGIGRRIKLENSVGARTVQLARDPFRIETEAQVRLLLKAALMVVVRVRLCNPKANFLTPWCMGPRK